MLTRVVAWMFGVPLVLVLALYARLLISPIDIGFVRGQAETAVLSGLPANSDVHFGNLYLSMGSQLQPVLRFDGVKFSDHNSGAGIEMAALEVGFSPFFAILGKPSAKVKLVAPKFQILQDLLGPRLAKFELVESVETGQAVVRIMEGNSAFPSVGILADGLSVRGALPEGDGIGLRSDNEWLILNVEGNEKSLADLIIQAREGEFSFLEVEGGTLEMLDPVYGLIREFTDIRFSVSPGFDGGETTGAINAKLAGQEIQGNFSRVVEDSGQVILRIEMKSIDFASLMPFLDDPDAFVAVRGAGHSISEFRFEKPAGEIMSGRFDVDVTGTELRIQADRYPIEKGKLVIDWAPDSARFTLQESLFMVGKSSAYLSGNFLLGLDDVFGPTIGLSLKGRDLNIHPLDLDAPTEPFSEMVFSGWSAPLYGAVGIDQFLLTKPGAEVRAKGRLDLVQSGIGINMEIGGEGVTADDLKRLWPYFISPEGRGWFVNQVTDGTVLSSSMQLNFPVGSLEENAAQASFPDGAVSIDIVGVDVKFRPVLSMDPIPIRGAARLEVRDAATSVHLDNLSFPTSGEPVSFANAAVVIDASDTKQSIIEISGEVNGPIPSIIDLAQTHAQEALKNFELPFEREEISGDTTGKVVANLVFGTEGEIVRLDYAVNGEVTGFASTKKIADRTISDGKAFFNATSEGYEVKGTAKLDDLESEFSVAGQFDGVAEIRVASTVDVAELSKLGFDASTFMDGKVRFVAAPLDDGALQLAIDLTDSSINLIDLGLRKNRGVPGTLNAEVRQDGTVSDISRVNLKFSGVHLEGDLKFDQETGLVSAEFSKFSLNEGDNSQLSVAVIDNGYSVTLRGEQFDLKPMLKRYFAVDQASTGGPQASSVDQNIIIDVEVKQALGHYGVTAYNFDLLLNLQGDSLRDTSLQTQFASENSVSIITNPIDGGRSMSVAVNDAGTLLRFLNVYPRLLGGSGSLVMRTNDLTDIHVGEIKLTDFAVVDEAKVVEVLGNHQDSKALIAKENRLNLDEAKINFIRRSDRIEITDAAVDGGSIGGTMRGFIYTKDRQYDLAGTYVPLFGLNNIFQKLPLIGQLIGGKDGEGLVGVTFAIRGDLDNPNFVVNPASILAPGIFRSLFEFRTREAPRPVQ